MNRALLLQAFGQMGLATALCGLAFGLLLLPQRLLQRPFGDGVVTLLHAPDGTLRLLNQPVTAAELRSLLAAAAMRRRVAVVRLVPDPATPWAEVRRLLSQLEPLPIPLELQLPTAPVGAG